MGFIYFSHTVYGTDCCAPYKGVESIFCGFLHLGTSKSKWIRSQLKQYLYFYFFAGFLSWFRNGLLATGIGVIAFAQSDVGREAGYGIFFHSVRRFFFYIIVLFWMFSSFPPQCSSSWAECACRSAEGRTWPVFWLWGGSCSSLGWLCCSMRAWCPSQPSSGCVRYRSTSAAWSWRLFMKRMRKSTGEMKAGSAQNAGPDARDAALKTKAKTSEMRGDFEFTQRPRVLYV